MKVRTQRLGKTSDYAQCQACSWTSKTHGPGIAASARRHAEKTGHHVVRECATVTRYIPQP